MAQEEDETGSRKEPPTRFDKPPHEIPISGKWLKACQNALVLLLFLQLSLVLQLRHDLMRIMVTNQTTSLRPKHWHGRLHDLKTSLGSRDRDPRTREGRRLAATTTLSRTPTRLTPSTPQVLWSAHLGVPNQNVLHERLISGEGSGLGPSQGRPFDAQSLVVPVRVRREGHDNSLEARRRNHRSVQRSPHLAQASDRVATHDAPLFHGVFLGTNYFSHLFILYR